ncbi:50S ribosomal protein L5 [Candidatus Daviesbacteria bacterium RIFCSPLOWO2_01_FULL_38_10]|uniref:Large ribosomal subunit protein uL5 n=1 Tax=Candidatus Daviesbacteria bacterium GW2011_GWF2_38_6 TaxID=1618432 RepID=A0A0G0KMG8_9BACT|nr:MAG: 50S ribosomal protein L5 [Candidatus Daviesbacteria bacterium GW2011_GWA2_38_17]KKQ76645.1 MAG: 50S ribosomal protein L5 [Candidatus Daviesbacteria bacterium GW2011_GWF2_38_6]OGE27163.1 MAG: 50S ribosomal protein L5 [Candidatus Daviesbacteria bacterium RIFCSPHIGHO2_02_FULL_39_41]OGE29314.1 MAG: 50S ribosomal protein L5 [Candidatus Daviesbacteria bacterium RIFCSPHIGHO2_01_FULL_38_8b]OGE40226.1 MAG: 50S ribosomal protein L5 [Candidatus Daviesbacteria bacterium RIFCSPLOWO2_01_FULL_38_10]O
MNRLKEKYANEVQAKLQEELGLKNKLAVPRLQKIVISIGLGEAKDNAGILDKVKVYLGALAGQIPVVTLAKKSVASFKVSKGQTVGLMVTLRGDRMYAFLDKLINIVLPKVRDFRGISLNSFDSQGNLNMGLKEQTIFPEVDYKLIDKVRGLAVTIATSAKQKEEGKKLLEYLGVPFRS